MTAQVVGKRLDLSSAPASRRRARFSLWLPPLAARPTMAVPPAKGLDEARVCAWLHKAALTPFPPVTKLSRRLLSRNERDSDES